MRASDLLGSLVTGADGTAMGHVHDLRLVQDGPMIGTFGAALRIDASLVGPTAIGVRLGFGRSGVRGPWPMKALFERIHDRLRVVDWTLVRAIEDGRIIVADADPGTTGSPGERPQGLHVIDAGLELLDRQIVDPHGHMGGNVDDLELSWPEGAAAPHVTAILAGPGALAGRLGGRLGSAIGAVHARLREGHLEGPARIGFGVVKGIGSAVEVTIAREDLSTMRFERWVGDHVIDRIPGSGRMP
jgi:sporulation protein YlmC with PRC-barrel domain